jgi:hypothetical protein
LGRGTDVTEHPPEVIDYETQNQRPTGEEIAVGTLVLAIGGGLVVLVVGGLMLYVSAPPRGYEAGVVLISATAICGLLALFSFKFGLEFFHKNKRAGR